MRRRQDEGGNYVPEMEIIKGLTGGIPSNEIIEEHTPTTTTTATGSVSVAAAASSATSGLIT